MLREEILPNSKEIWKRFDQLSQNKFHHKSFVNLNSVIEDEKFVSFCICLSASIP